MLYNVGVICGFQAGTNKAHAINTLNLANGFLRLPQVDSVTVFAQSRDPVSATEGWKREFEFVSELSLRYYSSYEELYGLLGSSGCHFYYVRDYKSTVMLSQLGVPYVVESHAHPSNKSPDLLAMLRQTHCPSCIALTTISDTLRKAFISQGAKASKVHINPDCVDYEQFAQCRFTPKKKNTIGYAGHLYAYKGIGCALWAMRLLPRHTLSVAGGTRLQVSMWSLLSLLLGVRSRVKFHGWIPHKEIPQFLASTETLLLPPSKHHPSARWTSPVKLGEYLASGARVVCSDIDALKDWVTEDQVWFFQADSYHSLSNVILAIEDSEVNYKADAQLKMAERLDYSTKAAWCLSSVVEKTNCVKLNDRDSVLKPI